MTWYCRIHPDFEGLDMGKLHDHIERDHPEISHGTKYKEQIAQYFKESVEISDFRRSDGKMILRTWGRPPKIGAFIADNEKEKR